MAIKVQDERKGIENYVNSQILDCVKFWNREGESIYVNNRFGTLGSKETNEMALNMSYQDFILEMLMIDCRTFCNSNFASESDIKFESGRVRSHVWLHENDNRTLMIYAE
jgi:hypothetical protein